MKDDEAVHERTQEGMWWKCRVRVTGSAKKSDCCITLISTRGMELMTFGEHFQSSDFKLAKTGQRTWPESTIIRPFQGELSVRPGQRNLSSCCPSLDKVCESMSPWCLAHSRNSVNAKCANEDMPAQHWFSVRQDSEVS